MTRKERIEKLLYHYNDVEHGLIDRAFRGSCSGPCALSPHDQWLCQKYGCANDGIVPRESRASNHSSYRELNRLLGILKNENKNLYWHLSQTYFAYREVRRAECPRCGREFATGAWTEEQDGEFCKHGNTFVKLRPVILRRIDPRVNAYKRELAIEWLDKNFAIEPFLPDDLLALVA